MTDCYILGAGAIGGLWAWRLQTAGYSVALLGRSTAPRELLIHDGPRHHHACFTEFSTQAPPTPITRLLITTKAQDTRPLIQALLPAITPGADIILLQNGLGVREELLQLLPQALLLNAITTEGVYRPSRNELVLAGAGDCDIGCLDPDQQASAQALVRAWQARGLPLSWHDNILPKLWQKLAINCAINPLTVYFDCRNGELLKKPEALALMQEVCRELAELMQAKALTASAEQLYQRVLAVAQATAANTSSMLADVRAGRATEIAYMNGYVVREAKTLGLAVPTNAALYQAARARQADQQP